MKLLFVLFMVITTQAYASEVCNYEETSDFADAHRPIRKSENHRRFTSIEIKMIHKAVTNQSWLGPLTESQALKEFGDFFGSAAEPGSLAGSIVYYQLKGKKVALVSYYPGDNEYGAFFEINGNEFKMIAEISDSFIGCK